MLPETTSHVYTGPFPARWSGWNFEHLINDTFVSTTEFLHKGIFLCIFAGIKPITFRSLTQAAWLCFSSCLRVSSIQVQSGQWKGALDLCILSHQNGKRWRAVFFFLCSCAHRWWRRQGGRPWEAQCPAPPWPTPPSRCYKTTWARRKGSCGRLSAPTGPTHG